MIAADISRQAVRAVPKYSGVFLAFLLSAVGSTAFADFTPPTRWVDDFGFNAGWRVENHPRMLADVNGDGRADVVGFRDDGVLVSLSTGTGFTPPRRWVDDFGFNAGWRVENHPRMLADVNGDGRADVVGFGNDGVLVSLSTGYVLTGFTSPTRWVDDFGFNAGGWRVENHPRMLADVNGDGRADVVGFYGTGVFVSLSTGTGFTLPRLWVDDFGFIAGGWRVENHPRMLADVNGDGRADVVGFGNDGVLVSLSTGISPTPGTGFTSPTQWVDDFGFIAGGWRVENHPRMLADVNGDGRADVVGFGNDGVLVSLSTGTGFTSPRLWVDDFGFNAGGWRVENHPRMLADVNDDGRADVVGFGNDGVFVSLSTGTGFTPPPREVAVAGLEVTQTVQDMAHSVGLITNKPTVVRAYLDINAPGPMTVSGDLLVWRPFPAPGFTRIVTATGNATVDPARNGQMRAQRENLTASLNFVLPPERSDFVISVIVIRLLNVRAAPGEVEVGCSNCAVSTRAISFRNAPPLIVRVLGLSYPVGTPPVTQAPRPLDFDRIASWLRRAYPTAQVQMTRLTIPGDLDVNFNCNQANAQVAAIRNVDVNVNNVDARTHYYGLVSDGGGFLRGCASGIPSTPDPSTVASGPTGLPIPGGFAGWDVDGSYGDWMAGHELGHTFGRRHVGGTCDEDGFDPGYPFPAGQLSDADGAFVGFDVGDPAAGLPMAVLPGTVWHDVMSYCDNQWISSPTYFGGIRTRLDAENALLLGAPATGVAVIAGAPQTEFGGAPTPGATASGPDNAVTSEMRDALERQQQAETARATEARESPSMEVREGNFVNVVATVNATANTGSIAYVNRVSRALVPSSIRARSGPCGSRDPRGRCQWPHARLPARADQVRQRQGALRA